MLRDDAQGRGDTGVARSAGEHHGAGGAGGALQAKWGDRATVPGQGGPGGAKGDLGGLEVELLYEDELELQLASY